MRKTDAADLAAVDARVFSSPWPVGAFEEEAENPLALYLVLERAGKIGGYAGLWLVLDEAQITNVALLPALRGRGWGKLLFGRLLAIAERARARSAVLEVRRRNETARSLYKSMGFTECGLRVGYYKDNGEDAVIMKKIIGEEDCE
jgi:ribosomal-protein-alanine N-acetyltransferase